MKASDLILNDKNPRRISSEKLMKLKERISEFPKMMELRPIIYDPKTMKILGGNMRLRVLRQLGYKEIPDEWVKPADKLTEKEKEQFIIEDNVQFGEWDDNLLSEWDSADLENWGLDFIEDEKGEPEEREIEPYKKTHILISFPPEKILELKEYLDKILEFDFIEYEQSSN